MSTGGNLKRVVDSGLADEETMERYDQWTKLTTRLAEIAKELPKYKIKSDSRRVGLLHEQNHIMQQIKNLKEKQKSKGNLLNDTIRNIVSETLPKEVYHKVLDEANNRLRGEDPKIVSLLTEKEIRVLEANDKASEELVTYKYRMMQLKTAINEAMPDLGKSGSADYQMNVRITKILSKLNSIVNQPI